MMNGAGLVDGTHSEDVDLDRQDLAQFTGQR
jgi:hypothetical protein